MCGLGVRRRYRTRWFEQIIENRAAGVSLRRIAASLAADGVPTAQGGAQWHASTVKAVLEGQAPRAS